MENKSSCTVICVDWFLDYNYAFRSCKAVSIRYYPLSFFPLLLNVKSLTERLQKMKDWAAVLGEDITDDDNLELEMKSDSGNGAHLGIKSWLTLFYRKRWLALVFSFSSPCAPCSLYTCVIFCPSLTIPYGCFGWDNTFSVNLFSAPQIDLQSSSSLFFLYVVHTALFTLRHNHFHACFSLYCKLIKWLGE